MSESELNEIEFSQEMELIRLETMVEDLKKKISYTKLMREVFFQELLITFLDH